MRSPATVMMASPEGRGCTRTSTFCSTSRASPEVVPMRSELTWYSKVVMPSVGSTAAICWMASRRKYAALGVAPMARPPARCTDVTRRV
ncbi:MAG: hypothetical protein IPI43_26490 [Sandaracinaceae bacterium]|nr:hypothetical protein [Sandaracinaceae bacterium]